MYCLYWSRSWASQGPSRGETLQSQRGPWKALDALEHLGLGLGQRSLRVRKEVHNYFIYNGPAH